METKMEQVHILTNIKYFEEDKIDVGFFGIKKLFY